MRRSYCLAQEMDNSFQILYKPSKSGAPLCRDAAKSKHKWIGILIWAHNPKRGEGEQCVQLLDWGIEFLKPKLSHWFDRWLDWIQCLCYKSLKPVASHVFLFLLWCMLHFLLRTWEDSMIHPCLPLRLEY